MVSQSHQDSSCSKRRRHCPLVADSVHASIQPSRQATAPEVVHSPHREKQEEVLEGADHDHPHSKAKNVIVSRVERLQDCLQKVP